MPNPQIIRDDIWLLSRLDYLWSKYFEDVALDNPVKIRFGRFSKYRLGSIKLNKKTGFSLIIITSMFRNNQIPVEVVDHTIGHELVHYAHGFSSNKRRLHKYPHAGGVVQKEMQNRGMRLLNEAYREWMKQYKEQLKQKYDNL